MRGTRLFSLQLPPGGFLVSSGMFRRRPVLATLALAASAANLAFWFLLRRPRLLAGFLGLVFSKVPSWAKLTSVRSRCEHTLPELKKRKLRTAANERCSSSAPEPGYCDCRLTMLQPLWQLSSVLYSRNPSPSSLTPTTARTLDVLCLPPRPEPRPTLALPDTIGQ